MIESQNFIIDPMKILTRLVF